ncbi:MAG: permease-like cell division protein FtsX [Rhodothermales bacterium]
MISYTLREGLAGLNRARFSTAASVLSMTVALVLLGLFAIVSWEARTVSTWLKQRVGEVELFLEETSEANALALQARAEVVPGVEEATFISKEQAQLIFRQEFGEEANVYFDAAFLPASIRVRVEPDYANADSLSRLVEEFRSWNRVDEVIFNQPLLVKVQTNVRLISMIGAALGILVIFASMVLVANTIRLTIYARRLMIRTMRLVGATDGFIRKPFLVEGIVQGVVAAALALLVLAALYAAMRLYIPQMTAISVMLRVSFSVLLVLTGIFVGWTGSVLAVGRFIKGDVR